MTFSLVSGASPATGVGAEFSAVILAARAGADWAWTRLYRSLAAPVLAYLEAHDTPDPESALGAVFARLADGLDEFDGSEDQFRVLAFGTARRELDRRALLSGTPAKRGPTLTRIDGLPPVPAELESQHVQAAVTIRHVKGGEITPGEPGPPPTPPRRRSLLRRPH